MYGLTSLALIASLVVSTSGLVMSPGSLHRRHAAAVHAARDSEPLAPLAAMPIARQTISERRALRQKRCLQRINSDTLTPTSSSSTPVVTAPANNVAPAPTQNDPAPSSVTPDAQPQTTEAAQNNSGGGGGGDTFSGQLTFYDVGLGACGGINSNSDMIAAASMLLYDGFEGYTGANPNSNPICNRQAAVTYQGKTITVTIVDRCVGCAKHDLDLSPTAFSQLADQGLGRLSGATWHFV